MPAEDLGLEAAELLSIDVSEARALNSLAELAAAQVRGCSAACAIVWQDGERAAAAASHPDAAELADLEFRIGQGPLTAAAARGSPVTCRDTLAESQWQTWAADALRRGIRSAACLPRCNPRTTLVLGLFGVRPAVVSGGTVAIADLLARLGGTAFANAFAYDEAQRTATQMRDSAAARAVTDQAKGILMHALGCDAASALGFLRRESQRRPLKVTEIAQRVIVEYGGSAPAASSPR